MNIATIFQLLPRLVTWARTSFPCICLLAVAGVSAAELPPWRASTPIEQRLDAAAFDGISKEIAETQADVQSVVVTLQGRKVYEFYRDDQPNALRPVHSVAKSALALLVGTALQRGQLRSLEQPVLELMPEWKALNPDPRLSSLTLEHLLSMTAGFSVEDPTGTAPVLAPEAAWSRLLSATPGTQFAYDNSVPALIAAVLERATGQSIDALSRAQLFDPLSMLEPQLQKGRLSMRTEDMAKLGHLLLRGGQWTNEAMIPPSFAASLVTPKSKGGPPTRVPYGLLWWVASRQTYFASGYGGQLVWVHVPLGLVIAVTSQASPDAAQRGQALRLARGALFRAAQKRSTQVAD